MSEFTPEVERAANAAKASVMGGSQRATYLAEAQAWAHVSEASDLAELVALHRGRDIAQAVEAYGLIPADDALNLGALGEDARAVIETIVEADGQDDATVAAVLYDRRVGPGFDAQRIHAAALILGLDADHEEMLAAVVGDWRDSILDDAELGDGETLSDQGGMVDDEDEDETAVELDIFTEAVERDAKGKGKKKGKAKS